MKYMDWSSDINEIRRRLREEREQQPCRDEFAPQPVNILKRERRRLRRLKHKKLLLVEISKAGAVVKERIRVRRYGKKIVPEWAVTLARNIEALEDERVRRKEMRKHTPLERVLAFYPNYFDRPKKERYQILDDLNV